MIDKQEYLRPGFSRVSLPYFLSEEGAQYIIDAVLFVAEHGWRLLPQYRFNYKTGEWKHHSRFTRFPERKWIGHVSFQALTNGGASGGASTEGGEEGGAISGLGASLLVSEAAAAAKGQGGQGGSLGAETKQGRRQWRQFYASGRKKGSDPNRPIDVSAIGGARTVVEAMDWCKKEAAKLCEAAFIPPEMKSGRNTMQTTEGAAGETKQGHEDLRWCVLPAEAVQVLTNKGLNNSGSAGNKSGSAGFADGGPTVNGTVFEVRQYPIGGGADPDACVDGNCRFGAPLDLDLVDPEGLEDTERDEAEAPDTPVAMDGSYIVLPPGPAPAAPALPAATLAATPAKQKVRVDKAAAAATATMFAGSPAPLSMMPVDGSDLPVTPGEQKNAPAPNSKKYPAREANLKGPTAPTFDQFAATRGVAAPDAAERFGRQNKSGKEQVEALRQKKETVEGTGETSVGGAQAQEEGGKGAAGEKKGNAKGGAKEANPQPTEKQSAKAKAKSADAAKWPKPPAMKKLMKTVGQVS
jgi:hypothetical protein